MARSAHTFAHALEALPKLRWDAELYLAVQTNLYYLFGRGNWFSLERLWPEFSHLDLADHVPHFEVQVFFLEGHYDWNVPTVLASAYFAELRAPLKRLVWFGGSAHASPFEQPNLFNEVTVRQVLPVARRAEERYVTSLFPTRRRAESPSTL